MNAIIVAVLGGGTFVAAFVWWYRRRHQFDKRRKFVRAAAAEAALDDGAFARETVVVEAKRLFGEAYAAVNAREPARLQALMGPELEQQWTWRIENPYSGQHGRSVSVVEGPRAFYVGLSNHQRDADDRAVVFVEAKLANSRLDEDGRKPLPQLLQEYWTLGKRDGRWVVLEIESRAEGKHRLGAPVVTSPWSDVGLRDEALIELAGADALPQGFAHAELAVLDFDADARAAALDLSLVDARFAPGVLEAVARRAVRAWMLAIEGDDGALAELATPEAIMRLLHGGDRTGRTRVVVREPKIEGLRIAAFRPGAEPPAMTVEVSVRGRRYAEIQKSGSVAHGNRFLRRGFTERWTLQLAGESWRIVEVGAA